MTEKIQFGKARPSEADLRQKKEDNVDMEMKALEGQNEIESNITRNKILLIRK